MSLCHGCGNYSGEVGETCPMCGATIGTVDYRNTCPRCGKHRILEQECVQDADRKSDGLEIQAMGEATHPFGR